MQAKFEGHSLLLIHSGLQLGGWPINVDKQVQDGLPLMLRHSELGPQGDGSQGLVGIGTGSSPKD